MITRPEYAANSQELLALAHRYEDEMASRLANVTDLQQAISIAHGVANRYHAAFEDLLSTALAQTGNAAVDHYDTLLGTQLSNAEKQEIVAQAIMLQNEQRYYGATLGERLTGSRLMNAQRIQRSSLVGKGIETRKLNLVRIFLNPYPFGAQVNVDRRILLSQSLKLEHDIALAVARRANVRIMKWNLSHRHKVKDVCDDYAEHVDKAVVKYLKDNGIKVDPKGLYFIQNVPLPPHPNCQCYLTMLHNGRLTPTLGQRALNKLKELLGRLGRKRKSQYSKFA